MTIPFIPAIHRLETEEEQKKLMINFSSTTLDECSRHTCYILVWYMRYLLHVLWNSIQNIYKAYLIINVKTLI